MMIRSWLFWVATALFAIISLGIIWKVYPPLLGRVSDQRTTLEHVNQNIAEEERYLAIVKGLKERQKDVDQLHAQASLALPVTSEPDLLLLQLDGLLGSLGLSNAKITVPFGSATTASASAATDTGDSKPGTVGNTSKPVVKSDVANQTVVTIAGEMDYDHTKALLTALRSFSRWNKVTALDITQSGTVTNVTVGLQVFTAPDATADFTGADGDFLARAKKLFGSLKQYATTPNYQTEGSFGRSNPFATP